MTDNDKQQPDTGEDMEQTMAAEDSAEQAEQPSYEELQQQLVEKEELFLRARADLENSRRRLQQDADKARKFAKEQFIKEMLPIIDSLERTLEVADPNSEAVKALAEGVQMTLKMQLAALSKFDVTPIDPKGEAFNPQFHEAMSTQESNEVEPGTVLNVFQKGYMLHERVIRPALVIVAKASQTKVDEKV